MRTALLLILLIFCAQNIFAQSPEFYKSKGIGYYLDFPTSIAVAPEGDVYVVHKSIIAKVKANGQLIREITNPSVGQAQIVLLSNHNLAILNTQLQYAILMDSSGNVIRKFAEPGPLEYSLNNPIHIEKDHKDNIFISDSGADAIFKFDSEGNFVHTIQLPAVDPKEFIYPTYFAVDKDENLHVLLKEDKLIQKFDQDGNLLSTFTPPTEIEGSLHTPQQIAFAENGDMLVVDEGRNEVNFYTQAGNYIKSLNLKIGMGGASSISKLAIGWDKNGNIYGMARSHSMDSRIAIYDPQGNVVRQIGARYVPEGIAFDSGNNIYMADARSGQVIKFNQAGQRILSFGPDANRQRFRSLKDLAVDLYGNVYTLESYYFYGDSSVVRKFDSQGKPLAVFNAIQSQDSHQDLHGIDVDFQGHVYVIGLNLKILDAKGELLSTHIIRGQDVAVDKWRQIYVTDYNGIRNRKYSPTVELIQQFGPYKTGYGQNATKAGITVDANGNVYVAKAGHELYIDVYDTSGQLVANIPASAHRVALNSNATKLIAANSAYEPIYIFNSVTAPKENVIVGKVYVEQNFNCEFEVSEQGIEGILVQALTCPYFALTDELGN